MILTEDPVSAILRMISVYTGVRESEIGSITVTEDTMVIFPIFLGSPLFQAAHRLFAMTFGLFWRGASPVKPASSPASGSIRAPEAVFTRAPDALEDDLALATWEDAEWQ